MSVTINGSGTVGGLSVGGLPDGTVAQTDLAPNVVGNGPAFSAYPNAAQSIPNSTWVKVSLQTKDFDTNGAFDNVTNFRFQPTGLAGYYMIVGEVSFAATGTYSSQCAIYKNGGQYKNGSNPPATTGSYPCTAVSTIVYLNGTTDYVELWALQNSGGAVNTNNASQVTYLQGYMVRSA